LIPAAGSPRTAASEHRGTAISAYYLAVNGVGFGFGPPWIGAINDAIGVSAESALIATSLCLVCLLSASIGAVLLLARSHF